MAKARRRSNGEGSIFKLPNGKWRVQIELPKPDGGNRRRVVRHCKTHAAALKCLEKLKSDTPAQATVRVTLRNHLAAWLERPQHKWRTSTYTQHENNIRNHIIPELGGIFIDALTPLDIDNWVTEHDAGDRTKQLAFDTLRLALQWADDMERIRRNPCDKVQRPGCQREDINPFQPHEAEQLINATVDTRQHGIVVLGLCCGLRQGELFGLRWIDADLKKAEIKIRQQATEVGGKIEIGPPKTEAGKRTIALPKMAVEALAEHRAMQMREGNGGSELVFSAPRGGTMRRGLFRVRQWVPLLKKLGITHRGAHHLRHTYATLALGGGVPVHVVSQVLGHTRPSTTLDLYAKAIPTQQEEAARVMQKILA